MMSSKATKRFVLVSADVYFAEARRDLVGLHSSSVLDPSEPKKIKLSQQEIRHEIIEGEKSAESPLEITNKKQQESNEKKTERATVRSA